MPTASSFLPLWNRADEWSRRLEMVRRARSFLYLSTYYIEWDGYACELLDALDDAQHRGVEVALLVDGFGQRLVGTLMSTQDRLALLRRLDALQTAGGTVTFYRPVHPAQRYLGGGQHVKIQVADTGEAIFGSSNITKTSFEGWNEFSVAVRGPIVRVLLNSWPAIGGVLSAVHLEELDRVTASGDAETALETDLSGCAFDYWCCNPNLHQGRMGPLGWRGSNEVTDHLVAMLDAARVSVQITAFYFKPVAVLADAVVRAARRGVCVEVFHSHREALPATDLAWIAAAVHYARLLDVGVIIRERRRGEHSKIVLIDDAWVAFGSYNFEDAAHDRLAEVMLASRDRSVVEPLRAIIDNLRRDPDNLRVNRDWQDSLPVTLRGKMAMLGPFKRWM